MYIGTIEYQRLTMLFCGRIYSTLSNGHKCIDYIIYIKFKEHMIFLKPKNN
jgi:hypothetical protein